jgi:cysteine sulfinate desulfinase/cysteine desulfurase-like protein
MVSSSSAATVTISSTAAASLLYIYYYSRKHHHKKGGALANLDILTKQSSDSDSDLSFADDSQGSSSHFHEDPDGSKRSFIPALSSSFGLSWSGIKDQEDDVLSFRMDSSSNVNANVKANANTRKNRITSESTGNLQQEEPPCIYLDYNGTTPIDQRVVASMLPFLTVHFGNPSSSHYYGAVPKQAIVQARKSILGLLHPNHVSKTRLTEEQEGVIFTGCGTEADNLAIHAAIRSHDKFSSANASADASASANADTKSRGFGFGSSQKSKNCHHIVTSNVEHPAIDIYLKALEKEGKIEVTRVPVKTDGCVEAEDMIQAIRPGETILVTLMLANNESGALQPVKQVSQYCRTHSILFHTDAAQAVGKVSIALDETGIGDCVDMITIVGHKFGAPKGIACLYVRPGCLGEGGRSELDSSDYLLLGGGQEKGKRAGTENVVSVMYDIIVY